MSQSFGFNEALPHFATFQQTLGADLAQGHLADQGVGPSFEQLHCVETWGILGPMRQDPPLVLSSLI